MSAEDIGDLNEQAMKLRETLKLDATVLAHPGLVPKERLSSFQGNVGYKNVAFELIDWANLLRDCWSTIAVKTALTAPELQNAKHVGEQLVYAAGLREQGPAVVAEVTRIRRQAVTLLMWSDDERRRAISYLRWHERDVESIAPSLYTGRGHKREDPAPAPPAAPSPAETYRNNLT